MGQPLVTRVKLKYVNAFRDRYGELRYYYRRRGSKSVPLPGLPGSIEFMDAYQAALAGAPDQPSEIGADRTSPGTINALVVAYYKSAAWNNLQPDTRKSRHRFIEQFRIQHGDKRVALLRPDHIEQMVSSIARPTAKRGWLQSIRPLLQSAVPGMRKDDPTVGIATIKLPKSKGHHAWTDDEIEQYRTYWRLGTQQRLVMEFALETVSRKGEVVRFGPQHVRHGRIRIERTHGSADVDIPMTPELQAACDAMPKDHLTYIVTAYGKPRSKYGLGNDFAKWATEAGLPEYCRMHGLKKGGMRRGAEVGMTTHELMAYSGHKTLAMVQHYTNDADKKRLADSGVAKLGGRSKNSDVTNSTTSLHKLAANTLKIKG